MENTKIRSTVWSFTCDDAETRIKLEPKMIYNEVHMSYLFVGWSGGQEDMARSYCDASKAVQVKNAMYIGPKL